MEKEASSNIIDLSLSLQEKETEIELIQKTFTEIGSELDLSKIFQVVSERARELIQAETVLIPLVDANNKTYTYYGGSGVNAEEIIGESLPLEFGICGWVWKNKKTWWKGVLEELDENERTKWEKEVGNILHVPLQGKKQFLGGIACFNKTGGETFDKKDLNLLQIFASIVSIAIENAMAVKSMEESNKLNENYRLTLEVLNKQLVESSKELEYLSLYDSITTLPNRSLFHDRLSRDITDADRSGSEIAILLIDIDSFKDINDTLGHDFGDNMLNKIARRFNNKIQNKETLARLGGDEFVVVLPEHDKAQAVERAELLLESLKDAFNIEENNIIVNACIGIAVYPDNGGTIGSLLSHADFAMYEAKSSNVSICVYDPENDHLAQGHLALVADVRRALEEKEFELHYQPKINTETGQLIAAEALGRWNCEGRGDVPPGIFIQVLEQNGLIDEYTYWAIETALKQAKEWRCESSALRIAVNLSPQTLMHPEFKEEIDRIIKNKKDGALLTFEITENLFLSEFDRLAEVLEYICSLGVELSIDDYGTGYSSLSRLRRLPVSEIKIDQSFIKDMVDNKDDKVVVRSTIELAHNLGLAVVAEGVETQKALDLLSSLGCDIVQGYLISKPLTMKNFNEFVKNKKE